MDMDLARMIAASGQRKTSPDAPSLDDIPKPNRNMPFAKYSSAMASELLDISVLSESVSSDTVGALKNFLPVPRENGLKTKRLKRKAGIFDADAGA